MIVVMPIYFFAVSIVFAMFVARWKKIPLLSPYGIFLAFQLLYNVTPWLLLMLGVQTSLFELLSDAQVINIQLWLAGTANLCFGLTHLLFYRRVKLTQPVVAVPANSRRNFVLLVLPLFLVTCILCEKYGWHRLTFAELNAGGVEIAGGMFTVTAYAKYCLVGIYLYYLYRFGIDKWSWVLLGGHVIVMLIDGGRTTFLPIALLTVFILNDTSIDRQKMRKVYLAAGLGIVLSIAARAVIIKDNSLLVKMTVPVTVEGTMGAYSSLQAIYVAEFHHNASYTYGSSYVFDPLVWFLPTGSLRNRLSFFQGWVDSISNIIPDTFSPMGGFYYLSEAVSAFYFLGPPIVTTLFSLMLVWVERHKNKHRLIYIVWTPTIGILFVKTIFGNIAKTFIISLVLVGILIAARHLRDLVAQSLRQERSPLAEGA
jgi:hypothetical protein